MSHRHDYRRRRREWQPSDRQRHVLDLVAEGKANAEIALSLGITLDGAKWHVSELLSETGLEDRRELAAWWREERRRGTGTPVWALFVVVRRFWPGVAGAGAIVVALLIMGLVQRDQGSLRQREDSRSVGWSQAQVTWPDAALVDLAAGNGLPSSCEAPKDYSPDELPDGLVSIGRVVFTSGCPVYAANRPERAVLWLAGGGYLRLPGASVEHFASFEASFRFEAGTEVYRLTASAIQVSEDQAASAFELVAPNVLKVRDTGAGTAVMIVLREAAGPGRLGGQAGPRHRVAVSSMGEMFIAPELIAGTLAVNWLTGEEIDIAAMNGMGRLEPTFAGDNVRTDCTPAPGPSLCAIFYQPGSDGIRAPADGTLVCLGEPGAYEFVSGDLRLRLEGFGGYTLRTVGGRCGNEIASGERLPVSEYISIHAFAKDGTPLSLVATRDGRLFIGHVALQYGCPCEPRN